MPTSLMRNPLILIVLLTFFWGGLRADEIEDIFKPFDTDQASLSPDGKHLAYSLRSQNIVYVMIRDLETGAVMRCAMVEDDVDAFAEKKEKIPSRITFLRWATADRLIISVDDSVIWGVDPDGKNAKELVLSR